MTVAGVPVIMARGEDGEIRAFVNMCSHRGNFVVEEGTGKTKNFRCNYHAWSYDLRGDLINIFDEANWDLSNSTVTVVDWLAVRYTGPW